MSDSPILVEKHDPERRRKSVTTLHCGCTCCCCCCLHTFGSLVGAAVAPAIGFGSPVPMAYFYDEISGQNIPLVKKPGLSAVIVFWWILCLLIFLCFAYGILAGERSGMGIVITAVVVALVFPVLQLASAFITLIVYAAWPRYDKFHQIKQLAKIVGGVVLGTCVGSVAMVGIAFLFGAFH